MLLLVAGGADHFDDVKCISVRDYHEIPALHLADKWPKATDITTGPAVIGF
jgi:hypothetical protein